MKFDSPNPNFEKLRELSSKSDAKHFYRNIIYFGAYLFGEQAKVRIKKIKIVASSLEKLRKVAPNFKEEELMGVQRRSEKRSRFKILFNLTRWGDLGKNWVKGGLVKSEEELRLQLAIVIIYRLFHNFAHLFDEPADFHLSKALGFEQTDISRISQMMIN